MICNCSDEPKWKCARCEAKEKFNNLPRHKKIMLIEFWELCAKKMTQKEFVLFLEIFDKFESNDFCTFDFNFDLLA